jgi:opacity protein-like surface antigen
MKKIILASSMVALMTTAAFASAQGNAPQAYVGGNYVFVTYEDDGFAEDIDLGALVAKVGTKINPYFSAELRAGFGVADETATVDDFSGKIEIDYLVGGYGVLGIPNETPVYPYVVLGFTKGELTASVTGPGGSASASASESDISYGIGANFDINNNIQMNAEYMNYIDKDGAEISGISVGASYLF